MRTGLLAILLLVACGSPAPPPTTTAVQLQINYDEDDHIESLSLDGAATARHFGPFGVRARDLPSGTALGLVFDATDAGDGLICVDGRDHDGHHRAGGCTMVTIVAGEIVNASVTLDN